MLAQSLLTCTGKSDVERMEMLYQKALARSPREKERQSLAEFLAAQRAFFQSHPSEAGQFLTVGLAPRSPGLAEPKLAAWMAVSRVVLGLHETITRY